MGLMSRAAGFLNRAIPAAAGKTVQYGRGSTLATFTAWPGQQQRDNVTAPGVGTRSTDRERDFQIPWATLVAEGLGEPQLGDRITETINGVETTFEASKRDREPHWTWADLERTRVRIFTRLIGPVSPTPGTGEGITWGETGITWG